jgi:hydrogenase maturation protein HypF
MAQLEYLPLPGGAEAIKKPYRTAIGYMAALGIDPDGKLPCFRQANETEMNVIKTQVEKGVNTPLTSSMGRLFDAVAAIIGLRGTIQYEAQAAIDLETCASEAPNEKESYPFSASEQDGISVIKVRDILGAVIDDWKAKTPRTVIATRFHNTIARMIMETCQGISAKTGIKVAALSGGVFQNRILLRKTRTMVESAGLRVYTHQQVPCNDGGISLGQAVIADANKEQSL